MKIPFKKVHTDAIVPTYAHMGDAGFDVYTYEEFSILPHERKQVPLGMSFEIPEGYAILFWDKSGLSTKHGITNLAGVIDASYRGEVSVLLYNVSDVVYTFHKGDKVSQGLIQKIEQASFEEVTELGETTRGAGGFGSTGKQ
jgi:dUTP pyrophosphatase